MQPIDVGTLLAGKYRLEALIGRGGMGSVWRAEHLGLTAPVAIKLLDLVDFNGSGEALARFHREARAAAAIRSPHVVQILDHGIDPVLSAPFIVMELMDGESLAQRLSRQGRISPGETARVMTQVARALSRAHDAGIVHRDLKPDNVFLVRNEDEEVAKVLDFGIAKAQSHALGGDSGTRTGTVMGTAYYMSPEQISGQKHVDLRTDLWALGVMAYECLSGARPFDAETIGGLTLKICIEPLPIPSRQALVPPGFDQWFARSVHRDPAQRFGSAREAAEALRLVCTAAHGDASRPFEAPVSAVPAFAPGTGSAIASTASPVSRSAATGFDVPKSPSPWPWLALGLFLTASAATGITLWWRGRAASVASSEPPTTSAVVPSAPAPVVPSEPAVIAASAPSATPSSKPAPVVSPGVTAPTTPSAAAAPAPIAKKPSVTVKPARSVAPAAISPIRTGAALVAKPKPAPVRDVIDDRH